MFFFAFLSGSPARRAAARSSRSPAACRCRVALGRPKTTSPLVLVLRETAARWPRGRSVSQSVITTLLPTEHMVHVYTHSVLNECVAESQSRGGMGLTRQARTCRHPACTGQHVWPARRYTHVTYVSRRIPKPLAEHPEQGAASKRRNVSPAGIPTGVACRVAA